MEWGKLILLFIRLLGLAEWFENWNKKKDQQKAQDAQTSINRDSDSDVDQQLRSKYTRD